MDSAIEVIEGMMHQGEEGGGRVRVASFNVPCQASCVGWVVIHYSPSWSYLSLLYCVCDMIRSDLGVVCG
jgi:hypothetical protein